MKRTTYNIDSLNKHQLDKLEDSIILNKNEQHNILKHVCELKDMLDNNELRQENKESIILNHLNSIGSIIANK